MKKVRPTVKLLLAAACVVLFVFVFWNKICPWGWGMLRSGSASLAPAEPTAENTPDAKDDPTALRLKLVDLQARQNKIMYDLDKAHEWLSSHRTGDRYEDMDGMIYLYSEVKDYATDLARDLDKVLGQIMVLNSQLAVLENRPTPVPDHGNSDMPVAEPSRIPSDPLDRLQQVLDKK